jgi:hypothetical protein
MRRFGVLVMVVLAATMAIGVGSAAAFEGGGRSPSEATLITYGQHYTAQLDNHESDANYGSNGGDTVAIWKLPPLSTHDQLTVNWHQLPFTHGYGWPICLVLAQGVNDYSWGETFRAATQYRSCNEHESPFSVSASGTAQTAITVQNTDASSSYLEFFAEARTSDQYPSSLETFPYDFSVEPPRHYIGLALSPVNKVATNGYLHASATLTNGGPTPDGYGFTLTATWSGNGIWTENGASVGGQITFPLALPETAINKEVTFLVSTGANNEYQAASSQKVTAQVTKPKAPAPAVEPQLCTKATTRAHVLARQYHRQLRHADAARGKRRRRLMREARATGRRLDAAKAARKAAC